MVSKRLTPYQRIVRNAKLGKGVVLTPDEVFQLSHDEAIARCAEGDDMTAEERADDAWAWREARK